MLLYAVLIFFLLLAIFECVIICSSFIGFIITRVPFVPTHAGDIEFIVKELNISSKDVFYDLGSGDGKVVFLVEKLSGAKTKGFELIWWTYLLAKIKKHFKKSHAELSNKNFFRQSWSEANIIYGYLYPPLMAKVEEKFQTDCKPGSLAIIRDFPFPKMEPLHIHKRPKGHTIYVYKI